MDAPRQLRPPHPQYNGRPVPFVVAIVDGIPRFSFNNEIKRRQAILDRLCGQCGKPLERGCMAFICAGEDVGDRLAEEPGMHRECAEYAFSACPFLSQEGYQTRERKIQDDKSIMVPWSARPEDRPKQMALVIAKGYVPEMLGPKLIARFGPPRQILWYREGELVPHDDDGVHA